MRPTACVQQHPSYSVINILAKLTTLNNDNHNTRMNDLYPHHFQALSKAGLIDLNQPENIPTLSEAIQGIHKEEAFPTLTPHDKSIQARNRARMT